ncbi:MAG: hypothetical protein ACI9U2_001798 [Bradymonadia bacterium]|jgi:hypothetical protein
MNMPVDPQYFADPARRSTPPHGAAANPLLHASQSALRFLLALTFGRRALADLSRLAACDADAAATQMWTVADDLAAAARIDRVVGQLVDDALGVRLAKPAQPYRERSICALATVWARHRTTLAGPQIAALLWVVVRSNMPCTRQFEAALVDEMTWRAARTLGAQS